MNLLRTVSLEENEHHFTSIETDPTLQSDCSLTKTMVPEIGLTLEEEFKIHELDAMKENFLEGTFNPHYFQSFLKNCHPYWDH